ERVQRHIGPPLEEVGDPVLRAMPIHDRGVFRPMADALAEDGGNDAVRCPLQQLPGKAAANAVAHVEERVDAEVIHEPELVAGARLLVTDADVALGIERHGSLSLHRGACGGRSRLDQTHACLEPPWRHYSAMEGPRALACGTARASKAYCACWYRRNTFAM